MTPDPAGDRTKRLPSRRRPNRPRMEELSAEYVAQGTLSVAYAEPWLADESDVETYVAALREALLGAIKSGKRVRI